LAFAKHNTVFKEFAGKPLKEWSEKAVKDVLKIFKDFDKDNSGFICSGELKDLCAILMIEASNQEADKLIKDGKIGAKEFFAWYVGCTDEEAAVTFEKHGCIFLSV